MKGWGTFIVGLMLVLLVGIAFLGTEFGEDRAVETPRREPLAAGTSGTAPEGTEDNAGPAAIVPPAIVQDITAALDGTNAGDIVGRRVELQATVSDIANDVAFWMGDGGDRVLVVIGRDNRDGAQRQSGQPASHGIGAVRAGQQVTISGTIQRLPPAEEMHSWGLTNNEAAQLRGRPFYLRAERVTGSAQGAS